MRFVFQLLSAVLSGKSFCTVEKNERLAHEQNERNEGTTLLAGHVTSGVVYIQE